MNKTNLQQVDYSLFRQALNSTTSRRIKNRGLSTFLYDQNNRIVALMEAAAIDSSGCTHPARYFIKPENSVAA
jgi:hypothetical protein